MIGIIIPVYKVEKLLTRCIESIICQKYGDYKILLVHGEAGDNSRRICDDYASKYPNIHVIYNYDSTDVSTQRNKGLQCVEDCDWITFVDADDTVDYNYFSYIEDALNRYTEENIIIFDSYFSSPSQSVHVSLCSEKIIKFSGAKEIVPLIEAMYTGVLLDKNRKIFSNEARILGSVWGKLYRRKVISNISFSGRLGEDIIFNSYAFMRARNIVYISSPVYNHIHNQESAFNRYDLDRENERKFFIEKAREFSILYGLNEVLRDAINIRCLKFIKHHFTGF